MENKDKLNYIDIPELELLEHDFEQEAEDLVITSWNPTKQEWASSGDAMKYFKLNVVLDAINLQKKTSN